MAGGDKLQVADISHPSPRPPPRRVEGPQRKWCRKTSVFPSMETGMSGNFVGRIKGAKYRLDLQFLTRDFS